jgi:integrase
MQRKTHGRCNSRSLSPPARFSPHVYCVDSSGPVITASAGLDPARYGTHSLRRTKATLIYKRTKNIRAIQLLLGHSKLESTVRYLGV